MRGLKCQAENLASMPRALESHGKLRAESKEGQGQIGVLEGPLGAG